MRVQKFLTRKQKERILAAIKDAEKQTSGEIRVHLEAKCPGDPLERAKEVFLELKMTESVQRNGVLIYLAVSDKKLAIFGDEGINKVSTQDNWNHIKETMLTKFRDSAFAEGIVSGIGLIGEKLKENFPYQDDDINELPDDISIN
jgi:uncharacterized membrane protein